MGAIASYIRHTLRQRFNKNKLDFLIYFITSKCDSRCKTCFNFERLNGSDDLNYDEIEKTTLRIGEFETLLLSGGEPFLRGDLIEVLRLWVKNNKVKKIIIPTNGMQTEMIVRTVRSLLESFPSVDRRASCRERVCLYV